MDEKFFKFDIEKLTKRILNEENKPVVFNASQWAMVEGLEDYRFWVHIAGRRTGKSFAAAILAFAKMLEPNTRVGIVAPSYNLSNIIWDYLIKIVQDLQLDTDKLSHKDRIMVLKNGSSVRLLSVNKREALIGRGYHFVIVDEAAAIDDDEYFTRDIRPTLSTYDNTRCLFITTPRGTQNYMYNYYQRGKDEKTHKKYPDWGSGLYTWRSNPRLKAEEIEEAKRSMPEALFQQEYECNWLSFEHQIYKMHTGLEVLDLYKNDISKRKMEYIAGLDVGYRDDTAFVVIATDYDKYYIIDEYVINGATTRTIAQNIKALEKLYGIQSIFIDSQAQQTRADLATDFDIYCDNSIKDVEAGIGHVQNLIEKDKLVIDPAAASKTLASMTAYKWKAGTVQPTPEHTQASHCCDAVRYAIYSHQKTRVGIYIGVN